MKKINTNHDNKDRIICVSETGKHKFYYQPVGTKERLWLFDTKSFSGSVFAFFRKYGRNLDGIGFSMTVTLIVKVMLRHVLMKELPESVHLAKTNARAF